MSQKYVSTSVKRASQQESSQGEPHTSQHVVACRCQGLLASAECGACGQHIVHQNNILAAGEGSHGPGIKHPFQRIHSLPSRGFGQGRAVSNPTQGRGRHVSIPRFGESGTQRLRRIESPAPNASPMGRDRHQCGVYGWGAPSPAHPQTEGLTMFGEPPILHAMNHGFCGRSKPESQPKNRQPRTLSGKDATRAVIRQRRPLPAARRTHPSHFVGQQRLPARPTASPASHHSANQQGRPNCPARQFVQECAQLTADGCKFEL